VSARAAFTALGTTAVAVTRASDLATARILLEEELAAIDLACSRFRRDAELVRLNARAGKIVSVSPLLLRALGVAVDAARATDGLVDPCLGADLRVAGYDRTFALVRARDRWTVELRKRTRDAWRQIEIDEAQSTVRIPSGTELDLGATAKALAADRAAAAIAQATGRGVLVSLGGDIAVAGTPPPDGWCVRVADDHAASLDGPGPAVLIGEGGLATSNTTVRRWRTDRGEVHHVLDPRTGLSAATPWRSATVSARTCVDANVASTAAIVLGTEAPAWLAERALPARLVAVDGGVVEISGWPAEEAA